MQNNFLCQLVHVHPAYSRFHCSNNSLVSTKNSIIHKTLVLRKFAINRE
eukprot:Gb_15768 [translate_table: standard]